MSITIEWIYTDEFNLTSEHEQLLESIILAAAKQENRLQGEMSITFCNNDYIQQINSTFRGIDRPTDVLSFPMDEEELLGDIIISIPKAREQAKEYGHSFERELSFLTIHGFLHLLGYDHETTEEEEIMFGKQEAILSEVGMTR